VKSILCDYLEEGIRVAWGCF